MAVAIAIAGAILDCVGGSGRGCAGQSLWSELWAAVAWLCSATVMVLGSSSHARGRERERER